MADQKITTSIDDLMTYLSEHGETESMELAKALGVNESIIETWADVLEKAKITKISYKVGKMYVSLSESDRSGGESAKKTLDLKVNIADTALQEQTNLVNQQITARIEELKHYTNMADSAFRSGAAGIKANLDAIEKLDAQINRTTKRLKERKDYVDKMVEELGKSIQTIEQKSGALSEAATSRSDASVLIEDIRNRLDNAEVMMKRMDGEFGRAIEADRRSFAEMMEGMRKENEALRRELFRQEKESKEYEAMAKSYGRESERVRRRVAGEKGKMLDEITKASYDVNKVYAVAEEQIMTVRKSLVDVKGQFGGYAELNDKILAIKGELSGIEKQKDQIAKDLGELVLQLKALTALKDARVDKRNDELNKINAKIEAAGSKAEGLSSQLDKVEKDARGIGR